MEKIKKKFDKLPNTGHMQLWLQRISIPVGDTLNYDEPLCKLAAGEDCQIWNSDWISSKKLKRALDAGIVDRDQLDRLTKVVPVDEMALFLERDNY